MTTPAIQIRDAVAEGYVEQRSSQTVADIAARLGWPETKVRRVFAESNGRVPGVSDYRVPEHLAPLCGRDRLDEPRYFPSLLTLAAKIRTLRGEGGTVHSLAEARRARQAGMPPRSLPRFTHAELMQLRGAMEQYLRATRDGSPRMSSPPDAAVAALGKLVRYAASLQCEGAAASSDPAT